MKEYKLFDKIKLKDGRFAVIVEIYEQGVAYEADIEIGDDEFETDTIYQENISIEALTAKSG